MSSPNQSKNASAAPEAVPAHDDLENPPDYCTLRDDYWDVKRKLDEAYALLCAISAFSFSETEKLFGYQGALKSFCEFKRQARRITGAQEAAQ